MATQAHLPTREPVLDRVRALAPAIREFVARHGASNPRVFGSVARGEEGAGSDVDILVDDRPSLSLLGLVRLERALAELLGRSVDVVVEDEVPPHAHPRIGAEALPL